MSGVFAVPRHGPEQQPRVRDVRGAVGAALAVRRHRAGHRRGGDPRTGVPGFRLRGRVRRPDHQLGCRVPRVRVQRDDVRPGSRTAPRPIARAERHAEDNGHGRGRVDGARLWLLRGGRRQRHAPGRPVSRCHEQSRI